MVSSGVLSAVSGSDEDSASGVSSGVLASGVPSVASAVLSVVSAVLSVASGAVTSDVEEGSVVASASDDDSGDVGTVSGEAVASGAEESAGAEGDAGISSGVASAVVAFEVMTGAEVSGYDSFLSPSGCEQPLSDIEARSEPTISKHVRRLFKNFISFDGSFHKCYIYIIPCLKNFVN